MVHLKNTIYVYTDGGIKGQNGKPESRGITIGSHAYILLLNDREYEHSEAQRESTSNREEVLAILHGLQKLNRKDLPVVVISDSQYCVNGITKWIYGWKKNNWISSTKEPVKNRDLWERLDEVVSEFMDIKFQWVRGHNGDEYNERCDVLCREAIEEFEKRVFRNP